MTYKELQEELQRYMDRNGHVEGYISQQERMAKMPCFDAIGKSKMRDRLSIKQSAGADRFYDIYAKVAGQEIRIGHMSSNGTVRRHTIQVHLYDMDRYGDTEAVWAFFNMATDIFSKKCNAKAKEIREKEEQLRMLCEEMDYLNKTMERINQEMDYISGKKEGK